MTNSTVVASRPCVKYSHAATASTTIQYSQFSITRLATIHVVTTLPQVTNESTYGAAASVLCASSQPFTTLAAATATATSTCWVGVHERITTSPSAVRPLRQSMNP